MATYKEIKGQTVSSRASDPASVDDAGLLYYNSTSGTFKVVLDGGAPIGAWATGGTMTTGRTELGSAGSQTSALAMGGNLPSPAWSAITEQYNGTSWAEVGDLNTPRRASGGLGTGSAALCLGAGEAPDFASHVEEWNGTGWTTVESLPEVRGYTPCGSGSVTAGLCFGGTTPPGTTKTLLVEKFNGTSWTEVASVLTGRQFATGCGTATASLFMGGDPGPTQLVEEFNGTSWTEVGDTNNGHDYTGSSGTTSTAMIYGNGYNTPTSQKTESWDGTAWTEQSEYSQEHGSAGTTRTSASAAAYFAGYGAGVPPGSKGGSCEEWSYDDYAVQTVTTS